jgi:hypothetical protein
VGEQRAAEVRELREAVERTEDDLLWKIEELQADVAR